MKKILFLLMANFIHFTFAADQDEAYQSYLERCEGNKQAYKEAQKYISEFEYFPTELRNIIKEYFSCISYKQWQINNQNLLKAAELGDLKKVKELLDSQAVNINAQGNMGYTPLMEASYKGNKDVVQLLITKGANVNSANYIGNTALIVAAQRGHEEIVELLINAKADLNIGNQMGNTALKFASDKNYDQIIKLLKAAGANSYFNASNYVAPPAEFIRK